MPPTLQISHHPPLLRLAQRLLWLWLLLWCTGGVTATAPGSPQLDLPRTHLQIAGHRLEVQLAITPEQRQKGLMFRETLPEKEGMLFLFEESRERCFWMKQTPLPLAIAFLDEQGRIVHHAEMRPFDPQLTCSLQPVRYVLEMGGGWFTRRGIGHGAVVEGVPGVL